MRKSVAVAILTTLLISTFSYLILEIQAEPLTIFSDGFETGDFSNWSAIITYSGTVEISSASPHHGSYNAKFTTDGTDNAIARIRKDFDSPLMEAYARAYVKLDALPSEYIELLCLRNGGLWTMARVRIRNAGGTHIWSVLKYKDGAETWVNSASSLAIATDTWIAVELHFKVSDTDGQIHLYINDNEIADLTETGFDSLGVEDHLNISALVAGSFEVLSSGQPITSEADCIKVSDMKIGLENIPPATTLSIDFPQYVGSDGTHITSNTALILDAHSPQDTPIAGTAYKIRDGGYDSGWTPYAGPFYLTGLADDAYYIDYNSTDVYGNVEPTKTKMVILDNTPPNPCVAETPSAGDSLQDGVTLKATAQDACGVESVAFSIREADGSIISPTYESTPATLSGGKWQAPLDTTELPDGYYRFIIEAADLLGNTGTTTVQFSIRNWATVKLLPASETNKAGRTMPVKFSIRIAKSVDPLQPFVQNEELTVRIYRKGYPQNVLQTSTFGPQATDYRIDPYKKLYITNFQTLKTPTTYVVEIYRNSMLLGSFEFRTVK